jgi:hypothetical protein
MWNKTNSIMGLCLIALATATIGCSGSGGGSGGGGGVQKPFGSNEQKAKALEVLGNSAKLVGMTNEVTKSKQGSLNKIESVLFLAPNEGGGGRTKPRDNRISDAVESGQCQIAVVGDDPRDNKFSGASAQNQKVDFKLSLSGASCPVELKMSVTGQASMQGDETNGNMKMDLGIHMELSILDEAMAKEYETRNLAVNAQLKMSLSMSQGQPGPVSLGLNGSMSSTDLNNQKAEISLAVSANLQNINTAPAGNLSLDVAITMPEFRSTAKATIRLQGQQQPQGTYLIDGRAASEEEFAEWIKALEELGLGQEQGSGAFLSNY